MPSGLTPSIGDVGAAGSRWATCGTRSDIIFGPHWLQVLNAAPGTYYLLLECRKNLDNLGLTLTLGDTDYLRCKTITITIIIRSTPFAEGWRSWRMGSLISLGWNTSMKLTFSGQWYSKSKNWQNIDIQIKHEHFLGVIEGKITSYKEKKQINLSTTDSFAPFQMWYPLTIAMANASQHYFFADIKHSNMKAI